MIIVLNFSGSFLKGLRLCHCKLKISGFWTSVLTHHLCVFVSPSISRTYRTSTAWSGRAVRAGSGPSPWRAMWPCHQRATPPARDRVRRTAAVQMCCWSVCRWSCLSGRVFEGNVSSDKTDVDFSKKLSLMPVYYRRYFLTWGSMTRAIFYTVVCIFTIGVLTAPQCWLTTYVQ